MNYRRNACGVAAQTHHGPTAQGSKRITTKSRSCDAVQSSRPCSGPQGTNLPSITTGRHTKFRPHRFQGKDTLHLDAVGMLPTELEPKFRAVSFKYALWFKQARRLQSYSRQVRVSAQACHTAGAHALWTAILRARGFDKSFADWWTHLSFGANNAPDTVPVQPPSSVIALAVFETFTMALRDFEVSMRKASRQYAKFRRQKAPNLMFMDLKDRGTHGVDMLVRHTKAQVDQVDPDTCQIVLNSVQDWDVSKPILCQGVKLDVIHIDHDSIWADNLPDLPVGATVTQTKYEGTTPQILQAFAESWHTRWNRHADVPESQWNQILGFAHRVLPKGSMDWPAMTPVALQRIIANKKKRSSTGLDGVQLADLRQMPVNALQAFCDMFGHAETCGEWPQQMVDGRITLLPKNDSPEGPEHFRPICVFSLLYRCWGSYNARILLQKLNGILPPGLHGNRPRHQACQVWLHLLWAIEASFVGNYHLHGIMADVVKAFNCIPRRVVFESLALIGTPWRVLTAWAGSLGSMGRRFTAHGNIGPRVTSVTGFPEGDGLSVVSMVAIDHLLHLWIAESVALTATLTFVDDWQFVSPDDNSLMATLEALDKFVNAVDLTLDRQKTYTWSTSALSRHTFRAEGFNVRLHGRNLGARPTLTGQVWRRAASLV